VSYDAGAFSVDPEGADPRVVGERLLVATGRRPSDDEETRQPPKQDAVRELRG
jgi:hypothetical protein